MALSSVEISRCKFVRLSLKQMNETPGLIKPGVSFFCYKNDLTNLHRDISTEGYKRSRF